MKEIDVNEKVLDVELDAFALIVMTWNFQMLKLRRGTKILFCK